MILDDFWTIVDRVNAAAVGDMPAKCRLLADELRRLPPEEVLSFERHFSDCFWRADTWDVSGAAHVISNGCGDDGFMDFRATLISLGRAPFEAALADADSLAAFEIDPAWAQYEGYQYVAHKVYEELRGDEVPERQPETMEYPSGTRGTRFNEWEMSTRYPRLVAKYGYKDSSWMYLKVQVDRVAKRDEMTTRAVTAMLDGGIVPSCGLIPPFRIVAGVLRTGHAPTVSGRACTWTPFELDEGAYWLAVIRLEKLSDYERQSRPDLRGVRLRQDLQSSSVGDFDAWLRSLRERGLA